MAMWHLRGTRRFPQVSAKAVYLMLSCTPATGHIESHFSYLQMLGGSRRAKTSLDNLRAQMKIMVDGPPEDDFVHCKKLHAVQRTWRHRCAVKRKTITSMSLVAKISQSVMQKQTQQAFTPRFLVHTRAFHRNQWQDQNNMPSNSSLLN